MPRPPAVVVLAAGASRRLGIPKALVEIAGRSALAHLVGAGSALDPGPVLVVTGADHEAIAAHVAERGLAAELVFRRDWAEGRTGGVLEAARRRPGRDLAVAPVDCPLVGPAVFAALGRAWAEAGAPARGWLAPYLKAGLDVGRRRFGHPVVCGRDLVRDLEDLTAGDADAPLRALRVRAGPRWGVPVAEPAVLDDVDRPADLERVRRREANRSTDGA